MKLVTGKRIVHALFDGKGDAFITDIADAKTMEHKNRCFITIRLQPGSSLGIHTHLDESEIYYILQGSGLYQDNDDEYKVLAGEATICKSGDRHGIINTGDEDLVLAALVVSLETQNCKTK